MSLHGSLDTFALADVLALLSTTGKKGELRVDGGGKQGCLWVDGGKVVGSVAGAATEPVDVLFQLLRMRAGTFDFEADSEPSDPVAPIGVDELLGVAQARLSEWMLIEAVIPSLESTVDLSSDVAGTQVTMTAEQWKAVVAVSRAATVHGVMEKLGAGEFETSRTLKDLVEIGLVSVGTAPALDTIIDHDPPAKPVKRSTEPDADDLVTIPARKRRAPAREDQSVSVAADPVERIELDPEEAAKLVKQLTSLTGDEAEAQRAVEAYEKGELDNDEDDPINRGLLLKFLSSVRS